jgi:cytochrome c biogenesis protein CcmG, thiol:disulfide interchange protein DsbE
MNYSANIFSGRQSRFLKVALIASLALPLIANAVDAGKAAPDFQLPGLKQDSVKLSNYKGKVVYLDFWASWCGPCKKTFPWLNELQKKYAKDGFEVVGVNVDAKRADADSFLVTTPAEFTVLLDPEGKVANTYELQGMPSSYIIDRTGKVFLAHRGFKDGEAAELEGKIKQLLQSK